MARTKYMKGDWEKGFDRPRLEAWRAWPAFHAWEERKQEIGHVLPERLVAFLLDQYSQQHILDLCSISGPRWQRRWYAWNNEVRPGESIVSFDTVDQFLIEVFHGDIMLSDLPPHCFTMFKKVRREKKSEEFKVQAIAMTKNTDRPIKDIAAELDICIHTLKKWIYAKPQVIA